MDTHSEDDRKLDLTLRVLGQRLFRQKGKALNAVTERFCISAGVIL